MGMLLAPSSENPATHGEVEAVCFFAACEDATPAGRWLKSDPRRSASLYWRGWSLSHSLADWLPISRRKGMSGLTGMYS